MKKLIDLYHLIITTVLLSCTIQTSHAQLTNTTCEIIFDGCEQEMVNYLYEHIGANNCLQWGGDCGLNTHSYRLGKVAIGSNSFPANAHLGVKGGVITNLLKVELCETEGWCDYVFEPNYKLLSLKELDIFIAKNGHLPNTPSATQIEEEGGFELKATKLNHQEKIEEIFLYLIQIQKRIKSLKKEIALLKAENKRLMEKSK